MEMDYLESARKQFAYYKKLGEDTFDQLNDLELFWNPDPEANSIAIIVNHLWGNMKSRWTDFLTADGEKEWRDRDSEFESIIKTREQLLIKWEDGWSCLFTAMEGVTSENFDTLIYIRNQGHTIVEAINRQLCHYSYHVGQIVFIGRLLKGTAWKSLSIPKGASAAYNSEKFSKEKHKTHFTEEFLKKGSAENQ